VTTMTGRMVGQITKERGDRAVRDRELGWELLVKCRAFRCEDCGFVDHGIPSIVSLDPHREYVNYLDPKARSCQMCGSNYTSRPRDISVHYHLGEQR